MQPITDNPTARFVSTEGRSEVVRLQWPVEHAGKIWSEITVRRITTQELANFSSSEDGTPPPGVEAPKEVLDALDAEDGFRVEEAANRFFPRRSSTGAANGSEPTSGSGAAS